MVPVPFIARELLERGPPMLDDYRVPAHRLPDQLPAGTEAVALAELAIVLVGPSRAGSLEIGQRPV